MELSYREKCIIDLLPDSVKNERVNLESVILNGRAAIRVNMPRLLTDAEKREMRPAAVVGVVGVGCFTSEKRIFRAVKKSYFYIYKN